MMKKFLCFVTIIACSLAFATFAPLVSPMACATETGAEIKSVDRNYIAFIKQTAESPLEETATLDMLEQMYNASTVSLKNYMEQSSLGKFSVQTEFLNKNTAFQLTQADTFYKPRYEYKNGAYNEVNQNGYDNRFFLNGEVCSPDTQGALEHVERYAREQDLIKQVVECLNAQNPVVQDGNADGKIDAITFLIDSDYGEEGSSWDSILWPHMSYFFGYGADKLAKTYYVPNGYFESVNIDVDQKLLLGGMEVYNYNFITLGYLTNETLSAEYGGIGNVGVICHEYMHNLGVMDYYSYTDSTYQSVGELDVMGITKTLPQYSLAYVRQKLGWLREGENVMPIETSGTYTLQAIGTSNAVKAYKLVLDDYAETGEYFMFEMRSNKSGAFDSSLGGAGLVVYRVNEENAFINAQGALGTQEYGNMYSDVGQEEIYIFREGNGYATTKNGKSLAMLNGEVLLSGYDTSIFGTRDPSVKGTLYTYKPNGFGGFLLNYRNSTICYSNGKNSMIALSNIQTSADDLSVTFNIEFDAKNYPVTENCNLRFVKGRGCNQVVWDGGMRSGFVHLLVVENTNGLVGANNTVAVQPTAQEIINGEMSGYNTLFATKTPVSFQKTNLDSSFNNCVVFALIDDGENSFVKTVCVIAKPQNGIIGNEFGGLAEFVDYLINSEYFKYAIGMIVLGICVSVGFAILKGLFKFLMGK